jgi:hypothetical protein
MKVNQIATILNTVYGEVLGETALVQEDLGNIVSVGAVLNGTSVFGENFDNYVGKIVDKVGRTIFVDRTYTAKDFGIWRDSWEYASALEKIRCEVNDYVDNCEWGLATYNDNISDHLEHLFSFDAPTVQSKYFNLKTTFRTKISITRKQLRSAFNGASEMTRFIAMIENRIRTKMEIAKQELERRTLVNLIAEHKKSGKQVIDLKTLYGTGAPATLTAALASPDALRFIAKTITLYRDLMTEPSTLYSDTGTFMNFTPAEDSRLVILSDIDNALKFNLYGDTYNEEFVKLTGYQTTPYWQGTGTDGALANRSKINVIPASENGSTEPEAQTINNLIGVLFDRDAAMICNEDPEVTSQYNADGNFTNYFYNYDCSYYNDLDENAIVFTWGD